VAIDGGKFKAVNSRDRNFSRHHLMPKPLTSNAKARGRFDKRDFIDIAKDDECQCPAGQRAVYRFTREENGQQTRRHRSSACPQCPMKALCTPSDRRYFELFAALSITSTTL